MASYNKFQCFVEDQNEGKHNLASDTLKVALSNTAPNAATNAVLADITQISTGFGYAAGGSAVTVTTSAQATGTYTLAANKVTFTASGGAIGPFRYAVLYNSTTAGGPLISWWDYGSSISLNDTETLDVKFSNTDPGTIFTET